MEWTVKRLIEHLKTMNPKDIVCATVWSREDVQYILAELSNDDLDTSSADVDELWKEARDIIFETEDRTLGSLWDELSSTFELALKKETTNA